MESVAMATVLDLSLWALILTAVAVLAAGFSTARSSGYRFHGAPFTMALVGACLMVSAWVVALAELEDMEQLPATRMVWLREDPPGRGLN
ncbi:hypothetical protein [Nonomuraea sp. NPDC002799]